jgi:ABC-type phosphate/phosphonate transport system substrate-binding protein
MGCVSYDPAVSDIWLGIQSYLNRAMAAGGSEPFDFCLFTNYPAQVRALLDGHIDVAWNGPIAHVMAERGLSAATAGATNASADSLLSLGMRDVDRDFRSVLVTRRALSIRSVQQLQGRLVLAGSWDSPQANVVPLYWLRVLEGVQPRIVEYNVDVGKHGDTAAGEVMLMKDLCAMAHSGSDEGAAGAVLSKMMWDRALEGRLDGVDPALLSEHYEVMLGAQIPAFDHCQFDAVYNPDKIELLEDFSSALMQMDMNDPEQKRLMCLEGINKEWVPPRQEGYDIVRKAMNAGVEASSSNHKAATNLFTAKSTFILNQRGNQSFHQQTQQLRSFSSNTSDTSSISRPKTIAVIGAGVAGLQTTRALQSHGFNVTCFDANSKVGGLWNSNYANFGVQVKCAQLPFTIHVLDFSEFLLFSFTMPPWFIDLNARCQNNCMRCKTFQ